MPRVKSLLRICGKGWEINKFASNLWRPFYVLKYVERTLRQI